MTEFSFTTVAVSSIWVAPDRQRKNLGDIEALAASISENGNIHPPTIKSDGQLVIGERRLRAIQSLGWSHVHVRQAQGEVTQLEAERIEYAENAHRQDLTWQENVLAVARYHELSKTINGGTWTIENSADELGISRFYMVKYLRVGTALRAEDKMVAEATSFATAYGICERRDARKADEEKEFLNGGAVSVQLDGLASATDIVPLKFAPVTSLAETIPILNTDFIEWVKNYTGPKFNLIHCDFPYGIDAGNHDQGAAGGFGGYEDSPDVFYELLDSFVKDHPRFTADAAHLIFWFSPKFWEDTFYSLSKAGWTVNPYPLIWHRSDNSGIIPDPKRSPRQVYETAFLCSRGDRFLVRAKSNLVAHPNTKQFHMSEKPKAVVSHFLEMLVDDTTTFLDPTCGSANSCIVAKRLGAKSVLGIEKSTEFYTNALANWKENGNG